MNKIKEMISMRMLLLSCTIQLVLSNVLPNFNFLGAVVHEKSLTQISLCIRFDYCIKSSVARY